jgi:hypothetical protein
MTLGRFLFLLAAAVLVLAHARAAPLGTDGCTKLKDEHSQLELAGVELDMAKGPEWAKANLPPEKIERIRRLIEVEAQLLFRCRDKSLVSLAPDDDDPAPTGAASEQDKKKAKPNAASRPPAKKGKAPVARKRTERAKKAAVRPAPKSRRAKDGAAKAKPAAKPPTAVGDPAPAPETRKAPPKARVEEEK